MRVDVWTYLAFSDGINYKSIVQYGCPKGTWVIISVIIDFQFVDKKESQVGG